MINWKAAGLAIAVVGTAPLAARGAVDAQRCATCTPDSPRRIHLGPALGLHVGTPQKASAALGLLRADHRDLLHRIDAKMAGEPELIDAAADVAIAILEQIDVFLHPLRPDAPRNLLINRHG